MPKESITQKELKEILDYDPDTGIFKTIKGLPVGGKDHGYIRINANKSRYYAHRLAWLYVYGEFPEHHIDHINHDGYDNRIANLRDVMQKDNCRNASISRNNSSKATGVAWCREKNKWRARIMVNRADISLGYFDAFDSAVAARKSAEIKYGFHPNHGG